VAAFGKTQSGDGTSVDQIVSAQPGLIPQMTGFLTSYRIWGTTNFCDHVSDFVYVHLMHNFTLEETLLAKRAYGKVLKQTGHTARHYHADNGRLSDKGFHKDIDDKGQEITFCGVGVHHQNGIIENRNKQVTLGARTLLLHGMRHWPQMVDSLFWPFAMKAMAERMNSLHVNSEGQTPESIMYGIDLETIPVKNFHTLFCPVYGLDHQLQSTGGPGPPKCLDLALALTLGIPPFMLEAWLWSLIQRQCKSPLSTMSSSMTILVLFPTWNVERSLPCRLSAESATDESVNLALEWMSGQQMDVDEDGDLIPIQDKISNPFGIVSD